MTRTATDRLYSRLDRFLCWLGWHAHADVEFGMNYIRCRCCGTYW